MEVINNTEHSRFEVSLEDDIAYIDYRWYKDDLAIMHTFVPEKFEGKGIAGLMAKAILEYAKKENLKIMVYCPYVLGYIRKNPEYEVLLDREFHKKGLSFG